MRVGRATEPVTDGSGNAEPQQRLVAGPEALDEQRHHAGEAVRAQPVSIASHPQAWIRVPVARPAACRRHVGGEAEQPTLVLGLDRDLAAVTA
jgi:hypothetical protein